MNFCMMNNLMITNMFFERQALHKYIRELISKSGKSIIECIVINNEFREEVKDTRVSRVTRCTLITWMYQK